MIYLILLIIILLALYLLVGALILFWISKWFNLQQPTYKKSLKILVLLEIVSIGAGILFRFVDLGILSVILLACVSFGVFHYLLTKNYNNSWTKSLKIYIVFAIILTILSIAVVIPMRLYIIEPFYVEGDAMTPTYNNNDYLLVKKYNEDYERGDVIVFRYDLNNFSIKRIIGLPNETVEIIGGTEVKIYSKTYPEGTVLDESEYLDPGRVTIWGNVIELGEDEYFVMGDNRQHSSDSRVFGPIKESEIEGEAFYKLP
ncbi:MAG: signal peptidase I [Parcubacteria group bacterium]